jgi:hypothetical protein
MGSSHSIGPKHGHESTKQKVEDTEEANLKFRSFVGCSELVGASFRPLIKTTSGNDKLCQDHGVESKKRKFDIRTGGGEKDSATKSINKVGRVAGPIMDMVASRSETLVIHTHKKARHMK